MFGSRKPADLLVLVGNFLGVVKGDPDQGGLTHMALLGARNSRIPAPVIKCPSQAHRSGSTATL